jgi:hypothetical protein
LDSGVLPPRSRKRSAPGFITGLLGGFVFGFLLIKVVGDKASEELFPGEALLVFVAALVLTVTVHECGHLLAGRALGFRFSFVSIGPFSLRLEHGMLKIRARREMSALGYAGMHVNGVRRLRRRLLIYIAGGPAANVVSVPLVTLLTNHVLSRLTYSWPSTLGTEFVMISILIVALSLLPLPGSSNDGSHIGMLLRSRDLARRRMSTIAVGGQQRSGIRAKYWRQTWLKAASSLRDNSVEEFSGNWVAYISASDRKEASLASAHLESCLELTRLLQNSTRDGNPGWNGRPRSKNVGTNPPRRSGFSHTLSKFGDYWHG